jgi:hypothetical protein
MGAKRPQDELSPSKPLMDNCYEAVRVGEGSQTRPLADIRLDAHNGGQTSHHIRNVPGPAFKPLRRQLMPDAFCRQ